MKSDCEAVCLFCRERISYQDRERKYFMKHLKRSHSIKYNLSYVIAINFLGQESRDIIVTKFEESSPIARTGDTDDIHVVEDENTKNSSFTQKNESTGMEYAEIEIDDDDDITADVDKPKSLKVSLDIENTSKENEIKHILMEDNSITNDLSEKDENNDATSKDNSVCSKLQSELELMKESYPMDIMEEESKTEKLSDVEKVGENSGTILREIKVSPGILSLSNLQNGEEFEEESKAKCDICKKAVSIVKKLMNHAESHAKKNNPEQEIKDEHIKIPLTSQLIKLATMTEKFTSACVMCQKVEGTVKKLTRHTKTHKKKCVFLKKEKCEVNVTSKCDKKAGFSGSSIKREMEQVNESLGIRLKKFDIKVANIGRENKDIVKNSTDNNIFKSKLVVDEKIIKCDNCNKLFNHPENLNKHFKMYPNHRNIKLQNESDEVTENMRDQIAAVLGL